LQALWVAAPLAVTLAVEFELWWASAFGVDTPDGWFEGLSAVLFGLAAVWLLSPYLKARERWVTFLRVLATLAAFSFFTFAVEQSPEGDGGSADILMGVAVFGLVLGLALNLAGWSCRRRYDWRRLSLWLILWLMAGWVAAFVVVSVIVRPGPLVEMATTLLIVSAVSFGVLLPFLLLSFTNAFYRARLHEVLRLAEPAPPPAPQPPAYTEA
jgi:hypothetical protein